MNKIDLSEDSYLAYDKGQFDKWCVYEINKDGSKKAPKDIDYFKDMQRYANVFGNHEIYNDFIKIYDLTKNEIETEVVEEIKKISNKYEDYSQKVFKTLSIIYMAMISEQNKKNTKLGKRIKRLGIYFLLVKGETPEYCANFMRGKTWQEIDKLCLEGNF